MATLSYLEPLYVGLAGAGVGFPNEDAYTPAQAASWRRGDFLQLITTGSITTPSGGKGNIGSTVAGPNPNVTAYQINSTTAVTNNGISVVGVATTGAPAASYFCVLTWAATGGSGTNESATGPEFVVNCAAGFLPEFYCANPSITNVGGMSVYVGLYPGTEVYQGTTGGFTSSNNVTLANPLTNNIGINRSVTNPSANIVGLAVNSSLAVYFSGVGGSFLINEQSPFGATTSVPPLMPAEIYLGYVIRPQNALWEISLKQPYFDSLRGTTAGLALDTASGFFIADTGGSNKVLTIIGPSDSVLIGATQTGTIGDSGKRIIVQLTSGTV